MLRILFAITLGLILSGLYFISYGFGDVLCTVETWLGATVLPLWSIAVLGMWYDVGRFLWADVMHIGSRQTILFNGVKSVVFILWMSICFTYVVQVHASLFALPLLVILPFLSIPFRDFLTHDWSKVPKFTQEHAIGFLFWATSSYLVYWVLTIAWALIRIWAIDNIDGNTVYIIQ